MEIARALEFVGERKRGVLATQRRDGRPQLSNVLFVVGDDGVISVSITDTRAKTRNLRRTPQASVHVASEDFWSYCVLDCDAELMPVAADPHDATVEALVDYYRRGNGEHPDWDEYRQAMVADQRLIVRLTATHAYGMLGR
jgi:PPOX class probable F420-dependent enzyme